MFKSKKKEKKEKSANSASSTHNETTHVQSSNNGGLSSTTYTRQTSSQSSQIRSTAERTYTVHHSASAGNVPQITWTNDVPSRQLDASPWTLGTGSLRSPALPSGSSRLPLTGSGSIFETRSNSQPRLSLPTSSSSRTLIPPRTALNLNTVASYSSTSSPSRPALTTWGTKGNVPQITSTFAMPSLQMDASPWTLGTGSPRSPALPSGSSRLPLTGPSSIFQTSSNAQPRLNLPTRSPLPPGTGFNLNPIASSRSPARPSPSLAITSSAQNAGMTQSVSAPTEPVIPTYSNNGSKRGKALLINNIKFIDKKDERKGAKKDSSDLGSLFRKIGFDVELKEDMKGKDMLKKVEQFSKTNFSRHDILVVVIMSHGNNIARDGNRVKGGYTEIAGIDNVGLLVDDIIEKFTASNCHPSIRGKPKIFIFQCCRGEKDPEVCHDSVPIKKVLKDHSDILISFSTLPGYLSNRDPARGSWYIQSICEVFEKHYKDHHIEDMLKIVDNELSKKHPQYTQTSTYESRGFKRCYLHPNSLN